MKKNIAVIFGGNSTEHDISILSGLQFVNAINKEKYNVIPIYIMQNGQWISGNSLLDVNVFKDFNLSKIKVKTVAILPCSNYLHTKSFGKFKPSIKIDCAVIALHGKNGEDGTIQGLFELANIPYTSTSVLGSSVGLDKDMMKQIFDYNKIPIIDFVTITKSQYDSENYKIKLISNKICFPLIVKPNRLGSSIGISICKTDEELEKALNLAFMFDDKVVVEKCVEDIKEVNISVLGYGENCEVSFTEEVNNKNGLLTFQKKYLNQNSSKNLSQNANKIQNIKKIEAKSQKIITNKEEASLTSAEGSKSGMQNLNRIMPANISKAQIKKIEGIAKKIFAILNCKGVVRIDFIIDQTANKIYANEINTIPGSFAFYLWEKRGIKFDKLAETLIEIAMEQKSQEKKYITKFSSNIF